MLNFIREIPERAGVPSKCIVNFIERLRKKEIPMHSFLLLRHDKLIAEGYYAPYQADTPHRMFSITKSFTSVAIGLLADEGKLSLDDPIVRYFPDKVPADVHPWISAMTIRDMLMMRTCHAATTYKRNLESDWVESFFTTPPTHPSGRFFHYDTSSAHTLCALTERLSGKNMLDYLKEKLSLLGLSDESYLISDPFGVSMGGSGLVAVPMDLLKFGYFIYQEGKIEGTQLLSASYLKEAVKNQTATIVSAPIPSEACGYGYQFWRNEKNGYVCYGMGGQLIIVLPEYDMICVTTADTQGIGGGNQVIYDALYEEILPFLSEKSLTEKPQEPQLLSVMLSKLQIAPLKGAVHSVCADKISGRTFEIQKKQTASSPAQRKFTKIRLEFSYLNKDDNCSDSFSRSADGPGAGTLYFTLEEPSTPLTEENAAVTETEYAVSFGLGTLMTGIFPIYQMAYAASGVWLSENTLYIKAHIIDEYVGSVHFELSFGDNDIAVFLKKQEESLFEEFQGHLNGTGTTDI